MFKCRAIRNKYIAPKTVGHLAKGNLMALMPATPMPQQAA